MGTIVSVLLSIIISSIETIYTNTTGKRVSIDRCTITPETYGYNIKYRSFVDTVEQERMELETDSSYSTNKWEYINNKNRTDLLAIRKNNYIILTGSFNAERIEKQYEIDSSPWKQLFPFDLGKSLQQDKEFESFWSISPKDLAISEFTAKITDSSSINIHSNKFDVYHVKIRIKGILSFFWTADSWYKKSDMLFVKYEGVNGPPTSPLTSIELQ